MSTTGKSSITVSNVSPATLLAEAERKMRKYDVRYEMSSEKMAALLELDVIDATAEVLGWYSAYQDAKLLRAKTSMTGTLGTTARPSTKAG